MAEQTFDVRVEREFDAPIERVWAAWTTPDDLRRGGGRPDSPARTPRPTSARAAGIFVTMRAPDEWGGLEQHSAWDITELDPPMLLRYVHRFVDAEGTALTAAAAGIPIEGVPDENQHEVLLTALGDGRTRLEMTEHGYTTESARDMSRAGLDQCLDKMADLVSTPPD